MFLSLLNPLLDLLYPNLCLGCGRHLPPVQELLCVPCQYALPETGQYQQPENAFTEVFWGRVPITGGAALYYFNKSGRVQRLIHQLKYEHKPEIGWQLGAYFGVLLRQAPTFQEVEVVVPVPLHPRKQHERGYNQAEALGRGIAKGMQQPLCTEALQRIEYTLSQTRKSRADRQQNVQQVFALGQADLVRGKHVLLVDDVLTTGATLEACATLLIGIEGTRVSLATLAMAE